MVNKTDIGKRFKELRLSLNLSQKEMADTIGKTQTAISQIEGGEYGLSYDTISALKDKFDIDENFLLKGVSKEINTDEWQNKYVTSKKINQMLLKQIDDLIVQNASLLERLRENNELVKS